MRLFLALMPPPVLRRRLGELADRAHARLGGRRVPDDSLHLTLAFLGEVPQAQGEALARWLETREIPAGEWRLDAWGAFRRPGIVWVGSRAPDRALAELQAALWNELEQQGIAGRPSRFIPHVTLLRRVPRLERAKPSPPDLVWPYRRVALLRSFTDRDRARYQILARSPLA
ncbi:2'-5'-RNA ligase [Halomonas sp. THAF5a]|uniref:RNA 2',3'-cyclic phosphodiesterase n=1 Tax=Halomonas sp. THAF5a TaxID=2587844 RepID=UPI001268490D|nr:RNA 2',3'-cyclic phosphodiesterase [Halomonas sp. THAF5a]QFU03354.1 2'-5'-RNA ligase [Halomonas sp. THAF5a]